MAAVQTWFAEVRLDTRRLVGGHSREMMVAWAMVVGMKEEQAKRFQEYLGNNNDRTGLGREEVYRYRGIKDYCYVFTEFEGKGSAQGC